MYAQLFVANRFVNPGKNVPMKPLPLKLPLPVAIQCFLLALVLTFSTAGAVAQCTGSQVEVVIRMSDSFGDGWNGNEYSIVDSSGLGVEVASNGLGTGTFGTDTLCLAPDCYVISVDGGAFQSEVTWEVVVGSLVLASGGAPDSAAFGIGGVVCFIPGCTNLLATNYDATASFDDGSCIVPVLGCTSPGAINYDPLATVDDGSCVFPLANDECQDLEEIKPNRFKSSPRERKERLR